MVTDPERTAAYLSIMAHWSLDYQLLTFRDLEAGNWDVGVTLKTHPIEGFYQD